VLYSSGIISASLMNVMTSTTCLLLVLVVIRKVLEHQLNLDQRRVYARKNEREECKSGLMMLMRSRKIMLSLLI
jgi:hypothetical protein